MPAEIVLSHGPRLFDEDGKEVPQDTQGYVRVSWSSEAEYVKVVTAARHPVTYDTVFDGFYVSLDRRGLNELIRHLRRARDRAFGRDE